MQNEKRPESVFPNVTSQTHKHAATMFNLSKQHQQPAALSFYQTKSPVAAQPENGTTSTVLISDLHAGAGTPGGSRGPMSPQTHVNYHSTAYVIHCVEGYALVLLCQQRQAIKKMAISLLKESRQLLLHLFTNVSCCNCTTILYLLSARHTGDDSARLGDSVRGSKIH